MTEPLDVERIRAYCEKATAGPWTVPHFAKPDIRCDCQYVLCGSCMGAICTVHVGNEPNEGDDPPTPEAKANGELIANARTDLPAAIDEIERLRAEVAASQAKLEWCYKYGVVRTLGSGMAYNYHPIDRETLDKAYDPRNEQERK